MIIGKFSTNPLGILNGCIGSPYGTMSVYLIPAADKDLLPDHITAKGVDYVLVTAHDLEIGCGWRKTSKDGKDYISIRLDGFTMPAPVNCALFPADHDSHHDYELVWRRDDRKPA